jgi:hypothetical protein
VTKAAQINGFLTRASPERIAQLESKVTAEQLDEIDHLAEINAPRRRRRSRRTRARACSAARIGPRDCARDRQRQPLSTVAV